MAAMNFPPSCVGLLSCVTRAISTLARFFGAIVFSVTIKRDVSSTLQFAMALTICFWNRSACPAGHFSWANSSACKERRCIFNDGCSDRSHWLWCPNSTSGQYSYRASKEKHVSDHTKQCNSQSEGQQKRWTTFIREDVKVKNKAATLPFL